ncbi:protein-tyrosine phosphatase-like protein [Trametes polyzona]|nr:protein-tyrosine phosphatase-like protein [Trametes polyzona]
MDLEPLDADYVADTLSKPPFVSIDGVVNVRDLGSYPTSYPGMVTRPRLVYRSGEVSHITPEGVRMRQLRELGITTIYDLRSETEMHRYETPIPTVDGVEIVHIPVFKTEDYSPEAMAKRFELYASGKTEAFMILYSQILDNAGPAFGVVLRHIRDRPDAPCLFHCTAGKDRTGILAAILLKLAGVDDDTIARDYALTRVGREPAREMIMKRLSKVPFFATNTEAALNMFSSRAETMLAFLQLLQERYGGVEAYVKNVVGLTEEDIATIRKNFLVPATPSQDPRPSSNLNGSKPESRS